jgi:hypothetical protein
MLSLAARLSVHSKLHLLDGGNRANVYPLARELRCHTTNPVQALQNIQVARAFTCYQVLSLLEDTQYCIQRSEPLLVFDLTATFYDESVPWRESRRLFLHCLGLLQEFGQLVPVVISARLPPAEFQERMALLKELCGAAAAVWEEPLPPQPVNQQLELPWIGEE